MPLPALPTFAAGTAPMALSGYGRGPAIVIYKGAVFYTRADINTKMAPVFNPEKTSAYGQIDKTKRDFVAKTPLLLFGLYENMSILFPSYAMNPQSGTSLFGGTEYPLSILAKNGDRITYRTAQITGLANLFLGVDGDFFAAVVEFTSIIGKGCKPTDAGAYYIRDTAAYAEPGFAKTNFYKGRWTGTWGTKTGFGAMVPKQGVNISWSLAAKPDPTDGYGTTDFIIGDEALVATAECTPLGPTMAQIDTESAFQSQDMGGLASANAADLTFVSGAHSVVLKNAAIESHETDFSNEKPRVGKVTWVTTRGFSAGVPDVVAAIDPA